MPFLRPVLFLMMIFFLGFGLACSKSKPPQLSGPFLTFSQPPLPAEKSAWLHHTAKALGACAQGNPPSKKETLPTRLGEFTNPLQWKFWSQGRELFKDTLPGEPLAQAWPKTLSSACTQAKQSPAPFTQGGQIQISLAFDFQTLSEDSFGKIKNNLARRWGLYGILWEKGQERVWWYPSEFLEKNIKFKELFEKICPGTGQVHQCIKKYSGKIKTFEVMDFISRPSGETYVDLYRLAPLISFEEVSQEEILKRLAWMREWYLANLSPEGKMTYLYRPSVDKKAQTHNNMIRQFMTTLAMFRLGKYQKDEKLLEAAERNLAFNLKEYGRLDEEKKIAYVYFKKKAKLGAAAFALMSVLESDQLPQREKWRDYLTNFIFQLQQEDGRFRTFYLPEGRNDNQNFYPGEALLALMTLYDENPKLYASIPPRVEKAFRYYQKYFKRRPNPAFVPWHTMAMFRYYEHFPKKEVAEFIFEMNDFLIQIQNTPRQPFTPEPDTLGRFYDPKKRAYGPPHASSTAIFTEGLIDALQLAIQLKNTSRIKDYSWSVRWGLRSLFQLQFSPLSVFWVPTPASALGALHTTVENENIRLDNTQHATMAFLNLLNRMQSADWVFHLKEKTSSQP